MKLKTLISALASVLLIGSQVAHADKWGDQFPHIAATGDIPGMCSYESMSKKDYSGRTLTICLLYTSPSPRDLSTARMPSSA